MLYIVSNKLYINLRKLLGKNFWDEENENNF